MRFAQKIAGVSSNFNAYKLVKWGELVYNMKKLDFLGSSILHFILFCNIKHQCSCFLNQWRMFLLNQFFDNNASSTPFLTIGIASYNYAQYLPRAFSQIKKQRFHDFEILYCDDGSSDGSRDIIQNFIHDNPSLSIRLVNGNNAGILANRNRILENARGKYLMICDADDYMLDDCLAELCNAALTTDADCVIGGFIETDASGHKLKQHVPSPDSSKWLYTWHHAQIYKTVLIHRFRLHFDELPDDVFFLQKIHLYSQNTVFVSKSLYAWVRHADSVSSDTDFHADWNPVIIWKKLSRFIESLMQLQTDADRYALIYYLYKWFYLNISDLSAKNAGMIRQNIRSMQNQMLTVLPNYRKVSCLRSALRTKDTSFAHMAVLFCWLLEKSGLLFLASLIRMYQKKFRNWRQAHGKT